MEQFGQDEETPYARVFASVLAKLWPFQELQFKLHWLAHGFEVELI